MIGLSEYHPAAAINTGDATNHMQVVCAGDTLQMSVNGTPLLDVRDAAFDSGDIGMIIRTSDSLGADMLFDNLRVDAL